MNVERVVVDASVAVKWLFSETHSPQALQLLGAGPQLLAPDLVWPEVGNAIWKRWRRGQVAQGEAERLVRDFARFPLRLYGSDRLARVAWELASRSQQTFYDCLYLGLAFREDCPLITADARLHRAFAGGPYGRLMSWIEDIAPAKRV